MVCHCRYDTDGEFLPARPTVVEPKEPNFGFDWATVQQAVAVQAFLVFILGLAEWLQLWTFDALFGISCILPRRICKMYLIDIIDIIDEDVEESLALDVSSAVEGSLRRKGQTPPLQSCRVRTLLLFASSGDAISTSYPCNDPWANSHSGRIYTSCIILWSCLAAVEWSSTSLDGANSNDAKPAMFQRFVAVQARRPVATCLVTGASVMSIGDSAVQLCGSGTLDLERNVVVSAYNAGLGSESKAYWGPRIYRKFRYSHRIFVLWDSFRERSEMVGDHS